MYAKGVPTFVDAQDKCEDGIEGLVCGGVVGSCPTMLILWEYLCKCSIITAGQHYCV